MKKIVLVLFYCWWCILGNAQTFDVDTLQFNGTIEKHINLVILSDGYMQNELAQFVTDAQSFSDAFLNERPFKEYANMFNVFIVKVPSNESGADHPGTATDVTEPVHPVIDVDNYFGSTFDFAGIHRLLVATNTTNISNVLANNFPAYDQALVLVNSPHYGGSGGTIPVASTDAAANEIAIHEIGHSFAKLADEYWAGDQFAGEAINMTKEIGDEELKWKNWKGYQGVGVYQHCCGGVSSSWFKPHQNCKMEILGEPFCSVCVEGIIEKIHELTDIESDFMPVEEHFSDPTFPIMFQVEVAEPSPTSLLVDWLLNNVSVAKNDNSLVIDQNDLVQGLNELKLIIHDTTTLLRVDQHEAVHFSQKIWTIQNGEDVITGLDDNINLDQSIVIDIYPNPSLNNEFNIKLNALNSATIQFLLFNSQGKLLRTYKPYSLQPQDEVMTLRLNQYDGQIFFIKCIKDGQTITTKKLLKH